MEVGFAGCKLAAKGALRYLDGVVEAFSPVSRVYLPRIGVFQGQEGRQGN